MQRAPYFSAPTLPRRHIVKTGALNIQDGAALSSGSPVFVRDRRNCSCDAHRPTKPAFPCREPSWYCPAPAPQQRRPANVRAKPGGDISLSGIGFSNHRPGGVVAIFVSAGSTITLPQHQRDSAPSANVPQRTALWYGLAKIGSADSCSPAKLLTGGTYSATPSVRQSDGSSPPVVSGASQNTVPSALGSTPARHPTHRHVQSA